MHSLLGLSVRGGRRRSLGGALRSYLRLGVGMPSLRGLGIRGSR